MINFDPRKKLQEEYDDKLSFTYWIRASLAKGEHNLVAQFLQKVPNTDKKGLFYFLLIMSNVYYIIYLSSI